MERGFSEWEGKLYSGKKTYYVESGHKNWVKEKKVKVEEGTNRLLEELERFDLMEGEEGLSREDGERREIVRIDLANMLSMEEISWRQKTMEK